MFDKKDKILAWTFLILTLIVMTAAIIFFLATVLEFNWIWLICFIVSASVFAGLYCLSMYKAKGYKLKYLILGKNYKANLDDSLQKFKGGPEEFISQFKKERKTVYRKTGKIFFDHNTDSLYKNATATEKIPKLYGLLYKSVLSGGGFVEFINSININDFESGWECNEYLTSDLISAELRYLINEVYRMTDFSLVDNGYSEQYSKRLQETIKKLNEEYSPMLFNFNDELKILVERLTTLTKKENSK